ncbi:hypothetical protein FHT26_004735 [Rhizobacter sp. SG703]|nr:hypothetical protein [Rhizobacter sp. SG703]
MELPVPQTKAQACRLANAVAGNSRLNSLRLHVARAVPVDSTVLSWLFSHDKARAGALSDLQIHIEDQPTGDTDWVRALCDALSTNLQTSSAHLALPWRDGYLKLLGQAICKSPCLSSLTLGGNLPEIGMLELLHALTSPACQLQSLSFPDSSFSLALVDAAIKAIEHSTSLIQLDLGDTPLTPDQRDRIATVLSNNRNIAAWEFLSAGGRI